MVGCQGLEPLDSSCPHPHGCNINDDIKKIILSIQKWFMTIKCPMDGDVRSYVIE